MNRMIRSRLSGVSVVLLLALLLAGCGGVCLVVCMPSVVIGCFNALEENLLFLPLCAGVAAWGCSSVCGVEFPLSYNENPDECAATWEQMQFAAIEFCEEYPDECQEAFDSWTEAEE
jgi:hypothetical protein